MSNIRMMPGAPLPEGAVIVQSVALLEELLAKAKAGELTSVAVAWTDHTDNVYTKWAHNHEFFKLQGAAAQLLHRMCM